MLTFLTTFDNLFSALVSCLDIKGETFDMETKELQAQDKSGEYGTNH